MKDRSSKGGKQRGEPQLSTCLPGWDFQAAAQGGRTPGEPSRQGCLDFARQRPRDERATQRTRAMAAVPSGVQQRAGQHICVRNPPRPRRESPETMAGTSAPQGQSRACSHPPPTSRKDAQVPAHWAPSQKGPVYNHGGQLATEFLWLWSLLTHFKRIKKDQTVCKLTACQNKSPDH